MAVAAHPTTIKIPGTSTAFTNEATTNLDPGTYKVYQITDANKRVLDPGTAIVIEEDADGGGAGGFAVVPAADYVIDPLFGKVTFTVARASVAVIRFASGNYLPMLTVATAREFSISAARDILEKTVFGDTAKTKLAALKDVSVTLSVLEDLTDDHDPGAGTQKFNTLFDGGTPVMVEIRPGGSGNYFRMWTLLESEEVSGSVADLVQGSINATGSARKISGQTNEGPSFSWGS